ncbi:MAG: diacylglycerol kinase family lipid kinase [Candidatus Kerfeldbacteria bacterium]|nr:diacylglycerol kinase family lipid kinase [Candidatus Kerfeldbacteria bacterium]
MAHRPRILVLLNPSSGVSIAHPSAERIRTLFRSHPVDATVVETVSVDDAYQRSRRAADEGYDRVVAAGGDGTIHTVIRGVLDGDQQVRIGILPIGSGNVLATELGLSWYLPRAVRTVVEGAVRSLDVAYLPDRQTYSFLSVATGYGARIVMDVPKDLKRVLGGGIYFLTAIRNMFRLRRSRVTIAADGVLYRRSADVVFITNTNVVWTRSLYKPDIGVRLDDGKFDLFIVRKANLYGWLIFVLSLLFPRYGRDPRVTHLQASRIVLHAYPDAPVQVDGEPAGQTPLTMEILRRAVRVIVRSNSAEKGIAETRES